DRRQQLGELIKNSEALLHSLAQQDAQIKATLANANAALGRTDTSLSGTAAQLNNILRQAPTTVDLLNGITRDFATNTDLLVGDLGTFDRGMKYSANVFGGRTRTAMPRGTAWRGAPAVPAFPATCRPRCPGLCLGFPAPSAPFPQLW